MTNNISLTRTQESKTVKAFQDYWIRPEAYAYCTPQQLDALNRVALRWNKCITPFNFAGTGTDIYLFGQVEGLTGFTMWLGIEKDGDIHS